MTPMEWHASSDADGEQSDRDESALDGTVSGSDIDVALQNQSLTLLALMAAHPLPHQALTRFRDLVDAWHQEPSEASLIRALQARAGRFAMNVDQVIQLLIPPRSAATGRLRSSAQASASARSTARPDDGRHASCRRRTRHLARGGQPSAHARPVPDGVAVDAYGAAAGFGSVPVAALATREVDRGIRTRPDVARRRATLGHALRSDHPDRAGRAGLAARRGGRCPRRTPPVASCRDGGSDTVDYGRASVGTDPHPPRR